MNKENEKELENKIYQILEHAYIFIRNPKETIEKIMLIIKENNIK